MIADADRLELSIQRAARRLETMAAELAKIETEGLTADDWLRIRARIGNLTADFNDGISEVDRILDATGAQSRILRYLQLRLGETVTKEELSGVAGIFEWARRVRELREDHGWAIHSAVTRDDLRMGEYVLVSDRPNENLAKNWALARQMKALKTKGGTPSPKTRILEYLKAIYPRPADREQLAYVAGSARESMRCIEDLCLDGWEIVDPPPSDEVNRGGKRLAALERG